MNKVGSIWQNIKESTRKNFKSATITYLLIMLVINGFWLIFGQENSVVGLIIAPMMLVLMARDMTAHPVRHFLRQSFILCMMATVACFSRVVPAPIALLLHFSIVFFLAYTYTCDCGDHMYFQYILNYLFLIFIGPISVGQLPLRLLAMVVGAGCLLLYQCIKGRDRVDTATRNVILVLLDNTSRRIGSLLDGTEQNQENEQLDSALKTFTQAIEQRRKASLSLSDAGIATIETVLSLEKLNLAFRYPAFELTAEKRTLLQSMLIWLADLRDYFMCDRDDIPEIDKGVFDEDSFEAERFYEWTVELQKTFTTMQCPENRRSFCKPCGSLSSRLKIAINYSPMRFTYALRLSCLLAVGILLVQYFHLNYGKWLLFTITSVSLPYLSDMGTKAKKRFIATLIGGATSLIVFALIPTASGKMAAMLFSGYVSCFLTDYLPMFACGTVGALGGAIMAVDAVGFVPIGGLVLTRIFYIIIGIIIALLCSRFICPMNQKRATRDLARKYVETAQALSESYRNSKSDLQLHYHLLIRMHRLENKLRQNSVALKWGDVHSFLLPYQVDVWQARELSA